MKNIYLTSLKFTKTITRFMAILFLVLITGYLSAQPGNGQIDGGIFESASPANQLEVRLRPTFALNGWPITNIVYTVRWNTPATTINTNYIFPYFVAPQGPPVNVNGWMYQVYVAVPMSAYVNWLPGSENVVSTFSYANADCSTVFQLINDSWTYNYNADFYVSVGGWDRTGIYYHPEVIFGPVPGSVSGGGTIYLGESTGNLTLSGYTGTITKWQSSYNSGAWTDIPGTAGLTVYSEVPTSIGTWQYRAVLVKGTCPEVYSVPATVIVVPVETIWTGNISSQWEITGNWTAGVPNEMVHAIIPDVTPNPFPYIQVTASAKNMVIYAGASVEVAWNGNLTLKGDFLNSGAFRIESTVSGTGSFIDNGNITNNGTCAVERYVTEKQWHYISPPISDALSGVFYHLYLKSFHEEEGTWHYIAPVVSPLRVMYGYGLWAYGEFGLPGDTLTEYEGSLNTGLRGVNVVRHPGAMHNFKGFNFVGNPYPSAVSWDRPEGWQKTNIDNTIYVWNPGVGNYGTYNYKQPSSGTNGVDSIIPAASGFFVHVNDSYTVGLLTVNNAARKHVAKDIFKSGDEILQEDEKYIRLKVYSSQNQYSDQAVIRFIENATTGFDGDYDAYKLSGLQDAPQVSSYFNDELKLAVNSLPFPDGYASQILYFESNNEGEYTLETEIIKSFTDEEDIFVTDLRENFTFNLKNIKSYEFIASPLDDPKRFLLEYRTKTFAVNENTGLKNLSVTSWQDKIIIRNHNEAGFSGRLTITDQTGRCLLSDEISFYGKYELGHPFPSGIYHIMIRDDQNGSVICKKLYIR